MQHITLSVLNFYADRYVEHTADGNTEQALRCLRVYAKFLVWLHITEITEEEGEAQS